jgi:glycosyltransferase involved in cell wall biosynthesis
VAEPLKLLIWSVIPTHHQSAFFAALRAEGLDVVVHYYRRVDELQDRVRLGWETPSALPDGEYFVAASVRSLDQRPDWRQRIHVVPGYNTPFLLRLALRLSLQGVRWVHWGEPSRAAPRSTYSYPVKRFYYGCLVKRFATGALAIGEQARADFERLGVPARRIRFLPYAVAAVDSAVAGRAAPGMPATATRPRFLFLGALCHRKGIDILLRAFRDVSAACPEAQLEIVGADESHGGYLTLAEQLGISAAVRIRSSVPSSQIADVFDRCDVFVLPSRFDGWGVVLNEAASAGKALISTDATGAAHHLIVQAVNGFRVPAEDSGALAQAMLTYCRDAGLAARHGRESRRIFAEFTPEQNARRLRLGLESLLADSRAVA